ncbi:peptide-N4-asparagine amidase [Lichenicola sp.]|uniref:peptide-N4-asparagine amidase n=1 Tax=Lichenicola sp. TaxID=2804529 RepID=UPI003AFFA1BB
MMPCRKRPAFRSILLLSSTLALAPALGRAATAAGPAVGSSNVASIEPPSVPHPAETPCSVPLFSNASFGGSAVPFTYQPPAACPGPWAKVVLSTDISLDAGQQYDRTATIFIGGVNMLFGTTAEPRAALAPAWHVERDVTDDTALLRGSLPGTALIANYTNSTDTSTITASSTLLFYPATKQYPAPATPDLVVPLSSDPAGGTTSLSDGTQSLSRTGTLPRNIEKARLDVLLQSQSSDEFWYTCVPNALSTALETCGGGAFREGQVAIDGVAAGVAPVYPWIYTGGIDPYLWEPIPGVQTLAFKPYSVELTPFAGAVDDGRPHTISLSVAGADNYFSVTGTLYLTLDHGSQTVRGAVTRNTLGAPTPVVTNTIVQNGSTATGNVLTTSTHDYEISGYAVTSHGLVTTTVAQSSHFSNNQSFDVTPTVDDQTIAQRTDTLSAVTTATPTGQTVVQKAFSYPLDLRYAYIVNSDGSAAQTTAVTQSLETGRVRLIDGLPVEASAVHEIVAPSDVINFTAAGAVSSHVGNSSAEYLFGDTATGCVTRRETSTNSVLSTASSTAACDLQGLLP